MQKTIGLDLPRISLCGSLPTPLEHMPRLSEELGGLALWIKRDDLTGLAFGGNKIRNHEFIFGEILAQGCDAVITTAGAQSNMCRATAAAAAKLGLKCVLLLRGTGDEARQGNLLLDDLLGADVRFIPTKDPYDPRVPVWLEEVKQELEAAGRTPYILHLTGATATLATCAYVDASQELSQQFDEYEIDPDYIYVTTGSGITAAGLTLGLKHLGRKTRVVGVSSAADAQFLKGRIVGYANTAAEKLNITTRVVASDFDVLDDYIGPGYGQSYGEVNKTIRRVAQTEAVLLDPVYTGKCFTGLLDQFAIGNLSCNQTVIFLHSGGGPNLFVAPEPVGDLIVYNKGIGGQNSQKGRARFAEDVLSVKPHYVFIYFGLNDTLNEPAFLSEEKYIENLSWMIDQARESGITPVLCTIHPVGEKALLTRHDKASYGTEGPNGKIDRYNRALHRLANEQNVKVADFARWVASDERQWVSDDGVHLTPAGHKALATCFMNVVADALVDHNKVVCFGDSVTQGAGVNGSGTTQGETYPAYLSRLI